MVNWKLDEDDKAMIFFAGLFGLCVSILETYVGVLAKIAFLLMFIIGLVWPRKEKQKWFKGMGNFNKNCED